MRAKMCFFLLLMNNNAKILFLEKHYLEDVGNS